jgi:hypothetical protein
VAEEAIDIASFRRRLGERILDQAAIVLNGGHIVCLRDYATIHHGSHHALVVRCTGKCRPVSAESAVFTRCYANSTLQAFKIIHTGAGYIFAFVVGPAPSGLSLCRTMAVIVARQLPRRPHAFRIANAIEVFALRVFGTPGHTSQTAFALTFHTLDTGNTGPAVLPAIRIRTAFPLVAVHAVAITLITAFFQVAFAVRGADLPTVAYFQVAHIALRTVLIHHATAFELPGVIGACGDESGRGQ